MITDWDAHFDVQWEGQPVEHFMVGTESLIGRKGAKSQLRSWLVERFPPCHCYVEPFGGSFKVLLWKPRRDPVEIINDVVADMVHLFRYAVVDPDGFCAAVNALPTHEALVLGFREDLREGRLTGLERAVAAYFSEVASFNDSARSYADSPYGQFHITADVRRVRAFAKRLSKVSIRCTDFERIICMANKPIAGKTFFYCDPPYWLTSGYESLQGEITFGWPEQERLARLCADIDERGNLVMQTNSAHPDLTALYGGFKRGEGSPRFRIQPVKVRYSVSGSAEGRGEQEEFVISNFDLAAKQKGLF